LGPWFKPKKKEEEEEEEKHNYDWQKHNLSFVITHDVSSPALSAPCCSATRTSFKVGTCFSIQA
jgi:hypothetical protein